MRRLLLLRSYWAAPPSPSERKGRLFDHREPSRVLLDATDSLLATHYMSSVGGENAAGKIPRDFET
jgi:hypothetical protein